MCNRNRAGQAVLIVITLPIPKQITMGAHYTVGRAGIVMLVMQKMQVNEHDQLEEFCFTKAL